MVRCYVLFDDIGAPVEVQGGIEGIPHTILNRPNGSGHVLGVYFTGNVMDNYDIGRVKNLSIRLEAVVRETLALQRDPKLNLGIRKHRDLGIRKYNKRR